MGIPIIKGPAPRTDAQDLTNSAVREHAVADQAVSEGKIRDGAITGPKIGADAVDAVNLRDGAVDVAKFASGIRPVHVVATLPEHPYTGYVAGDLAFLMSDAKVYRLTDVDALVTAGWSKAVDGADIIANSITAGQIQAGAISTDELAADAVSADKIQADAVGADQLAAMFIDVAKYIRSSDYAAGESGWAIDGDGVAEFFNVLVRGTIEGSIIDGGSITGATMSVAPLTSEDRSTDFSATASGSDPAGWTIQAPANAQVLTRTGAVGGKRFQISRQADFSQNYAAWADAGDFVNADLLVKLRFNAVPTWIENGPSLFLRATAWSDSYEMALGATLSGAPEVRILESISTPLGQAALANVPVWETATDYYMRFRAHGTVLSAKVWKASEAEPGPWSLVVEDSTRTSGGVAVAPGSGSAVSAAKTIEVDTVEITNLGGAFNVGPDGTLYMGGSDPLTAPFRVDPTGLVDRARASYTAPVVGADLTPMSWVQSEIQAWSTQYDAFFTTESNTTLAAGTNLLAGASQVTLPAGWGSMDLIFFISLTMQYNARGAGRSQSIFGLTLNHGSDIESWEIADYHEVTGNQKMPYAWVQSLNAVTSSITPTLVVDAGPTFAANVIQAEANCYAVKMRRT